MAVIVLIYLVILYLIFVPRFFNPVLLIVFLAGKRIVLAVGVHTKPRPAEPPKEWPGWPTWFSGFAFFHNRLFSDLFVIGILADCLLRIFLPAFWMVK
jgi:1,4-dihydroxy-2-naphthoate octaprenyltransferase